jgi:hypothetical protein
VYAAAVNTLTFLLPLLLLLLQMNNFNCPLPASDG